jgi:hypothetical protein
MYECSLSGLRLLRWLPGMLRNIQTFLFVFFQLLLRQDCIDTFPPFVVEIQ